MALINALVPKMFELLHANDIVWGFPEARNLAIDDKLNAVVIGLDGSRGGSLVDRELSEKKEGDWQGVRRLLEEWLPSRCID